MANKRDYNIVVYGGGSRGRIVIRWLRTEGVEPLCVIDKDTSKDQCILDGIPIYMPESFLTKVTQKKLFSLDAMFMDKKITLIKMDIEGAELSVLKSAKKVISQKKPVLAICVYHKPEDLVEIPNFIHSCCPEYRLYLRKYQDHARSPRGEYELVPYAIPESRKVCYY